MPEECENCKELQKQIYALMDDNTWKDNEISKFREEIRELKVELKEHKDQWNEIEYTAKKMQ